MNGISTSPLAAELTAALKAVAESDRRLLGVVLGGSAVTGTADEFSDLDFVIVCRDEEQPALLAEATSVAGRLGPLLAAFTGEHVGEPRLLIALYGPPLLHVDLKFVAAADLSERVEDGIVVWERDGAVTAAMSATHAEWPSPDLQWIEDRFWIWIRYAATKLGRGELFECLDLLAYLRAAVFGPMVAVAHGVRPQGVRRIESFAPEVVPRLAATVANPRADELRGGAGGGRRAVPQSARRRIYRPRDPSGSRTGRCRLPGRPDADVGEGVRVAAPAEARSP